MSPASQWQTVIRHILEALIENFGYKGALVRQVDAEHRMLLLTAAVGLGKILVDPDPVDIDKSGIDRDVLEGQIVEIADYGNDIRTADSRAAAEGIEGMLAAPLALRSRMIGVLRVLLPHPVRPANRTRIFFRQLRN